MSGPEGEAKKKQPKSERLKALLPDLVALIRPRRRMLAGGFVLMAVGRAAGLVLPASTKVLIDDVVGKSRTELLLPLLGLGLTIADRMPPGANSSSCSDFGESAGERALRQLPARQGTGKIS